MYIYIKKFCALLIQEYQKKVEKKCRRKSLRTTIFALKAHKGITLTSVEHRTPSSPYN